MPQDAKSESLYESIQPIILAGGKGSRITQLIFGRPKCLVQVANKPLLQYTLEMLVKVNMRQVIVIVLDNELIEIKKAVTAMNLDVIVEFKSIPANSLFGTADSLRALVHKDAIPKDRDVLLIPCDVVTDADLRLFVKRFYQKNSSVLCMFTETKSEKDDQMPARKLHTFDECDYVGFDSHYEDRLVLFEPDVNFDAGVPLKKSFLEKCPNFSLSKSHTDTHIYLIKKWVLKYLDYKKNISSIKTELLPSLVRKQFRSPQYATKEKPDRHVFDFIEQSPVDETLAQLEFFDLEEGPKSKASEASYPNSLITCYAFRPKVSYMIRINSWVGFCEANRIMLRANTIKVVKSDTVKSFMDGMLGSGSSVGEKCCIKRTIIGSHCKIGNSCKLISCIVQDGVAIGDGVTLNGCLLCHDVNIGSDSEMSNCIVGPGQKIPKQSKFTNESINEEEY